MRCYLHGLLGVGDHLPGMRQIKEHPVRPVLQPEALSAHVPVGVGDGDQVAKAVILELLLLLLCPLSRDSNGISKLPLI